MRFGIASTAWGRQAPCVMKECSACGLTIVSLPMDGFT